MAFALAVTSVLEGQTQALLQMAPEEHVSLGSTACQEPPSLFHALEVKCAEASLVL
jgi:hypothetical protein